MCQERGPQVYRQETSEEGRVNLDESEFETWVDDHVKRGVTQRVEFGLEQVFDSIAYNMSHRIPSLGFTTSRANGKSSVMTSDWTPTLTLLTERNNSARKCWLN